MLTAAHSFDPESRPSCFQAVGCLPSLAYRLVRWHALRGGWLPGYLRRRRPFDRRRFAPDQPIDVMVLFSDHFEPARRFGDAAAVESVRSWCAGYEALAGAHHDTDGKHPQHTWFYRYDYPNLGCLRELAASTFRGFGEVEFHLHHGPDTHAAFANTLQRGLDWFNSHGALCTAEAQPRRRFGYVAGNSALDNGAGDPGLSGCDTELWGLRDAGCFADFTYPALGSPAQPSTTNSIYYAREDGRPKSHDSGVPVEVGREPSGDLMIFQGPVAVNWTTACVDDGALENTSPASARRLSGWLSAHVHVTGRPEWVFIKLSTHGMQNRGSFLGAGTEEIFTAMEHWWNRPPFRLHYVSAREAFNIVKAAEAGHSGSPNDYRDFAVPMPANRVVCCNVPWKMRSCSAERLHVEIGAGAPRSGAARLQTAWGNLRSISGRLRELEAHAEGGALTALRLEGEGPFEVVGRDGTVTRLRGPGAWRPLNGGLPTEAQEARQPLQAYRRQAARAVIDRNGPST